ncbi:hypothetical protein GCM10010169_25420 [Micromonospora fulviviridis]|uniref:phage major capsid protein n=1 Tax=Micromonospora fulviviridis TaxID=47860 RepID=UPI00166ADD68|nr:phage major capsid protein [Micromonospora fulviviridis]GGR80167.1 hypothetical protein GCM10010169_25420 [Micromonospora fulviviridis]
MATTIPQMIGAAIRCRDEARDALTRREAELTALRSAPDLTEDMVERAASARDQARRDLQAAEDALTALTAEQAEEERVAEQATQVHPTGRRAAGGARVSASHVYRQDDPHGPSWIRDMIGVSLRADSEAGNRLRQNNRVVAGELSQRALTTTDGAGGDFVPPLWLMSEMAELARAGRVTANLVRNVPLPAGTDTINLPKVATGTAVAEQATQNTAVQNTDATTATVTSNVATVAGQQVISVQLVEQSPVNMDDILLRDLLADLAVKTDIFVINNNVANKRGLLNVSGINPVTFTSGTPTVATLYPKLADAIQQIATGRFLAADAIVMHPRRWAWFMAAADTANRPLVVPGANGPQNAIAIASSSPDPATGLVGSLMGLPVYTDANIPVNLGAGTNEDRIIVMRRGDHILYEGTPRAEAFREPLAAQLSILLRVYNYLATAFERYPKAISVISGTGLVTPTF